MDRKKIKNLIELATSFDKANAIIDNYTPFTTDEEKIAYLSGMFNCKIVGRSVSDVHTDYVALLTAIVEQKWRGLWYGANKSSY